jgi:hypothetical protein
MTKEELAEQTADDLEAQFNHYDDVSVHDVANAAFLAGWEAKEKSEGWVSVEERPNTNCTVAVRTKNHTTEIMSYHAPADTGKRDFHKWMFGRWMNQTHLVELWKFLFVHPPTSDNQVK